MPMIWDTQHPEKMEHSSQAIVQYTIIYDKLVEQIHQQFK
jgi:hypothetical protein